MKIARSLIGVLIGESEKNIPIGNIGLIKALTKEAFRNGAILFAFTPQVVNNNIINGFLFHPKSGNWLKHTFPIPDVVYIRTPYRTAETNTETLATIEFLKSIGVPFFNQYFFNKKQIYQVFSEHPILRSHVPETTSFRDFKQLQETLNHFDRVYVKPSMSNKGEGIFTLEKSERYYFKSNHQSGEFSNFSSLIEFLKKQMHKDTEYLLQRYIEKVSVNDRPFDLRVIAHRFNNQWNVTGVGIRCAGPGNVTTHVPSGGRILSEDELLIKIDHKLLSNLVVECGEQLDTHFGPVKEFSLDIGIDTNGSYWIFEANSRPMTFDEPHIKEKIPVNLMKAILEETGFTS